VSIAYRLMYRLGFTPWDRVMPSELIEVLDSLPPGRALDLGAGKGTKAVMMASHGWQVTAVENVPRALAEGKRRAKQASVTIDFRLGDVTRLEKLKLEPGYTLVFDFGCFHGLNSRQREAYISGVKSLAAPGATLLMMAFSKPLPPITTGVTASELMERFGPDWRLEWSRPQSSTEEGTAAMGRAAASWFCLKRS
jgi:SAM-dependent methyltransferase